MTSSEPARSSAYSEDLRWKIVWQVLALDLPVKQVAANLCVDQTTVRRIVGKFEASGQVKKKSYPVDKAFRKLNEPAQFFILYLILDRPGIYLREIQNEVLLQLGLDITVSAICKFLDGIGFTRQRIRTYASQRDDTLRAQFVSDVSLYSRDMIIFLDETGTDRRDTFRKKGYSLRGKPAKAQKLLVREEHVSAICLMSTEGMLACDAVSGSVDGERFIKFVENYLLPNLMPFNGYNPRSIVIMDNCSIHHVDEVQELIQQTGALIHYLPPYSPDYNPIEEAFSKAKSMMKAMEVEMQVLQDTEMIVYAAFSTITASDCQSWITDSVIYA